MVYSIDPTDWEFKLTDWELKIQLKYPRRPLAFSVPCLDALFDYQSAVLL